MHAQLLIRNGLTVITITNNRLLTQMSKNCICYALKVPNVNASIRSSKHIKDAHA